MDTDIVNSTANTNVKDTQNKVQYAKKITLDEFNKQKDEYTQIALKELNEIMKLQTKPCKKMQKNSKLYTKQSNIGYDTYYDNEDYNNRHNDKDNEDGEVGEDGDDNDDNEDGEAGEDDCNNGYNNVINRDNNDSYCNGNSNRNSNRNSKGHGQKHVTNTTNATNTTNTTNATNAAISINATANILAKHEKDNKLIIRFKEQIHNLEDEINNLDGKLYYMKLDLNNLQVENNELKNHKKTLLNENKNLDTHVNVLQKQVKYDEKIQFLYKWLIVLLIIMQIIY